MLSCVREPNLQVRVQGVPRVGRYCVVTWAPCPWTLSSNRSSSKNLSSSPKSPSLREPILQVWMWVQVVTWAPCPMTRNGIR